MTIFQIAGIFKHNEKKINKNNVNSLLLNTRTAWKTVFYKPGKKKKGAI